MASLNWGDERVPGFMWKHIAPEPNSDCWFWVGHLCGSGNPSYYHKPTNKRFMVRRTTYSVAHGGIPTDKKLHVTCGNSVCCNPSHMRLGAHAKQPERLRLASKRFKLRKYGLSVSEYESMLEKQNGRCAICPFEFGTERMAIARIDHCHKTGAVRGLLCGRCNSGLGFFKDTVSRLESAIEYLKRRE